MTAASKGSPRWRLSSVTVRGFRGVAKEKTFLFDGHSALVKGNNGTGKSTVALALQWILFGRFPEHVLGNVTYDRFLSPVTAKTKGSFAGTVVLSRGAERVEASRDGKAFTLKVGGEMLEDEDAESRRDALLGLDMDTFSRAVLLQQSRVRGLLLDEVKERNKALDRLLGMDAIELMLEVVKPKLAADAAQDARQAAEEQQESLRVREKLLGEQLEQAQGQARTLGFLNKSFNSVGLSKEYAELGDQLKSIATEHEVAVAALPPCDSAAKAEKVASSFAAAMRAIRIGSQRHKRLAVVKSQQAEQSGALQDWKRAVAVQDQAQKERAAFITEHGSREALLDRSKQAAKRLADLKSALKTAGLLRQLLADSLDYARAHSARTCPVCEQALPGKFELPGALEKRIGALASENTRSLDAARVDGQRDVDVTTEVLRELDEKDKSATTSQLALEKARQRVAAFLGGAGIAESKILGRLEESLAALKREEGELAEGVSNIEHQLGTLAGCERALASGLVPVIRKREELAAFEAQRKEQEAANSADLQRADAMDGLADRIERIRRALLDAKEELAHETLDRAKVRAQELYRTLVRHPLFDTLDIKTVMKARKVDYAFEVSSEATSGSAREARMVLSDGQLTGAALALFFALGESTQHNLDLLYVDDPTQNLDLPAKEAMAKVVTEMAKRRQIVVSTQDEDFASFLEAEGFGKTAFIHQLSGWKSNPTLVTQSPEKG